MPFQMQIPEMFSYVGMKDKEPDEVLLILTQMERKWKKEFKLNTILLLKLCMSIFYIYLFASFPFCIYLYFYFQYLSTFNI